MGGVKCVRQRGNMNQRPEMWEESEKLKRTGMPSGRGRVTGQIVGGRSGRILYIMQRSLILFYRQEGAIKRCKQSSSLISFRF